VKKIKLTSDAEKCFSNCLARTGQFLSMASFEAFEIQVIMDNSPDRHSWKIQFSRYLAVGKMFLAGPLGSGSAL